MEPTPSCAATAAAVNTCTESSTPAPTNTLLQLSVHAAALPLHCYWHVQMRTELTATALRSALAGTIHQSVVVLQHLGPPPVHQFPNLEESRNKAGAQYQSLRVKECGPGVLS